jgi:hypothetical protein
VDSTTPLVFDSGKHQRFDPVRFQDHFQISSNKRANPMLSHDWFAVAPEFVSAGVKKRHPPRP